MKILIVIDSLGSGGAERSTAVLSNYLVEQGVDFSILCLDRKTVGVQHQMQDEGYDIHFVENGNFLKQVRSVSEFIKNGKFDLVHSILFRSNIRTRFAKFFKNFFHLESLVNTTYSKERFHDKKVNQKALWFYKHLDKRSASWAVDHYHSITETVKEHYVKEINLDPKKISVIPRGRKPLLKSYNDRPQKKGGKIELINVGRHEFQKGQIYLLQAIKALREQNNDVHLKILGRDGSTTTSLKDYIKENQLEKFVSLEGFKHNVPDYLMQADIFVFPSLFEGLGGALIEAQAAGLPIACNDIPVLHEVVQENVNAKFFDVHNTSSIVEAIKFFIEDSKQREIYGKKSLKNYKDKYVEEVNNERILNLYRELIRS